MREQQIIWIAHLHTTGEGMASERHPDMYVRCVRRGSGNSQPEWIEMRKIVGRPAELAHPPLHTRTLHPWAECYYVL